MWRTRQRGGTREARRWAPATFDEARLPGSHSRATLFCRSRQTCELFNALLKPRQEPETRVPSSRPLSAPSPTCSETPARASSNFGPNFAYILFPWAWKEAGRHGLPALRKGMAAFEISRNNHPPPFHEIKGFRLWWRRAVSSSLISSPFFVMEFFLAPCCRTVLHIYFKEGRDEFNYFSTLLK